MVAKRNKPAPSATTSVTAPITTGTTVSAGTLTGTINPVGAAANISATITLNGQPVTYNATLNNDGSFEFQDFAARVFTSLVSHRLPVTRFLVVK